MTSPTFILPSACRPLVNDLMADPNPEGEAFLTRAALNGANILYLRCPPAAFSTPSRGR